MSVPYYYRSLDFDKLVRDYPPSQRVRPTSRQCRLITLNPSGSRNPDALSIASQDVRMGPARQEDEEFGFASTVRTVVKISQHIGLTEL